MRSMRLVVLSLVTLLACSTAAPMNACDVAADCPATTACATATCMDGRCTSELSAQGTACSEAGGKVCDGAGACVECVAATDCPAAAECSAQACNAGRCGTTPVAAGTPTASQTSGDCKTVVCDGAGSTMMIDADDPQSDGNDCTADTCVAGVNVSTPLTAGTACATSGGAVCGSGSKAGMCVACISNAQCAASGRVCDTVNDVCVAPTCTDLMKDGSETDIDCGGSTCSACGNGMMCSIGGDCTSGYCAGTTCAACTLDTQCPGTSFCDLATGKCTPDKSNGNPCGGDGQCVSGHCSDNLCCDQACNGTCQACSGAKKGTGVNGTCGAIILGLDPDNECPGIYACGGAGACQSCSDSTKNGAETDVDCGGGTCGKCGTGKMCSIPADCLSNTCTSGTCGELCGNGTIGTGEQCDDNNTTSGDGCSSTCSCEVTRTKTLTSLNVSIPDNLYNGSLASMACVTVAMPTVLGCGMTASSVRVTIGMSHTWIGDLVIKVVSPNSTTVTVMSRPGFAETVDDGSGGPGYDSDLSSTSPVTFQQVATTSAENMGAAGGVVCRDDGICTYIPNNGAAPAGNLTAFNGQIIAGNWKVCVGDAEALDTGTIDSVSLIINN